MSGEPTADRTELTPYRPRTFRALGTVGAPGGFRVKLYSIQWSHDPLDEQLVARARDHVLRELPTAADDLGDHYQLGFAILHAGQLGNWLLMQWWAHADILCLRLANSAGSEDFARVDRPYHGCVWEGVVVQHEHRAWIRTMLTSQPDPDAYLADLLPNGSY